MGMGATAFGLSLVLAATVEKRDSEEVISKRICYWNRPQSEYLPRIQCQYILQVLICCVSFIRCFDSRYDISRRRAYRRARNPYRRNSETLFRWISPELSAILVLT
jgi:hypothetical protein